MWKVGIAGKLSLVGVKHVFFREEPGEVDKVFKEGLQRSSKGKVKGSHRNIYKTKVPFHM